MFILPRVHIYTRPFSMGCAVPFAPPRVFTPAPFFGGCSFMPLIPRMPVPIFTSPFSFGLPVFNYTNIFIQNTMYMAKRLAASYKQQLEIQAALKRKAQSNYQFGSITASTKKVNYTPAKSSLSSTSANRTTTASSSSFLDRMGYNLSSGVRLARTALSRVVGFTGNCATYVKNAIASCGLGSYIKGDAYEMIRILRNNRNFKEISVNGVDPKKLPPGCILVYGKGVSGYSSKAGHTEITTGDGRAVSDGITNNIRGNVTAIFMPVA